MTLYLFVRENNNFVTSRHPHDYKMQSLMYEPLLPTPPMDDTQPPKVVRVLTTVCSWCGRVRVASGVWKEEDTPEVRALLESNPDDTLTHGICPPCSREIIALLTA